MLANDSSPLRRPALTLIELLVVMAIMATLAALGIFAFSQVAIARQKSATESTIQRLTNELQAQWKAALDQARQDAPGGVSQLTYVTYLNARLTKEFPMNYDEARLDDAVNGIKARPTYKSAVGSLASAADGSQSSACLYLALKQARRGQSFDPDTALPAQAVQTRADGLKQIVDSWGSPLRFKRMDVVDSPPANYVPWVIYSVGRNGIDENGDGDDISSQYLR
jgi:prepilin-type N-terminal cleavage/methylation domain-containing protein